ncbi:MAG: trehalose-6-phosphate synthase [Hyphomicrobiaceae bacterium]
MKLRSLGPRLGLGAIFANPIVRYAILALAATAIMILALTPLTTFLVEEWSERDLELRATLAFRSIREPVATGLRASDGSDIATILNRLAEDERILGLGFCTAERQLIAPTRSMPPALSCESIPMGPTASFGIVDDADRRLHVGAFPVWAGSRSGHLLVVHDLSFLDRRIRQARAYTILGLAGIAIGLGLLASVIMFGLMRAWNRTVRHAIVRARRGSLEAPPQTGMPIGPDVRSVLRELRRERRFTDGIYVEWSPSTLQRLLVEELPDTEVLVVSNREPYIHNHAEGGVSLQIPASGLVAALEPVVRACGGTWIAHGSGSADRETVDAHDRVRVPPANPAYTLRRVWLTEEEQAGYYYGFANEGLWPLCHIAFVRPIFREEDWACYRAVNERFADVVAEEATSANPIVLVQDYHFALLPRMIRDRLPKATIIAFWHIPWPNAETFGICPRREEIIDGLLGSTILGFHTQFHCNNFIEATDRFVESRIDRELASVSFGGRETLIRPYPISIEWPPAALADQASVEACRSAVRARFALPDDVRIAVGIERFDYTKGILDRLAAIDDLLTRRPEWRGKLVFVQAAAPTRSKLDAYSALQADAEKLAAEINARHGAGGVEPIRLVIRHHDPAEVFELFRAADICIVSSLHDGMNLVAKEFVAARDDNRGVLILSSFAGASRELGEALIVNPYDTHGMAEAVDVALRMSVGEQQDRMSLMRDQIRQRNVYRWAAQMLQDAARIRRREHILPGGLAA